LWKLLKFFKAYLSYSAVKQLFLALMLGDENISAKEKSNSLKTF